MGRWIPPTDGRYDPYAFPETGPDKVALKLMQQGAPGAPQPMGTCSVAIKLVIDPAGKYASIAMSRRCRKYGKIHRTGKQADAIMLAEIDAHRMDGHQCSNRYW